MRDLACEELTNWEIARRHGISPLQASVMRDYFRELYALATSLEAELWDHERSEGLKIWLAAS